MIGRTVFCTCAAIIRYESRQIGNFSPPFHIIKIIKLDIKDIGSRSLVVSSNGKNKFSSHFSYIKVLILHVMCVTILFDDVLHYLYMFQKHALFFLNCSFITCRAVNLIGP